MQGLKSKHLVPDANLKHEPLNWNCALNVSLYNAKVAELGQVKVKEGNVLVVLGKKLVHQVLNEVGLV